MLARFARSAYVSHLSDENSCVCGWLDGSIVIRMSVTKKMTSTRLLASSLEVKKVKRRGEEWTITQNYYLVF